MKKCSQILVLVSKGLNQQLFSIEIEYSVLEADSFTTGKETSPGDPENPLPSEVYDYIQCSSQREDEAGR